MSLRCFFFFFNDTATTEIYTLSLHDALPISCGGAGTRTPTARFARSRFPRSKERSACSPPARRTVVKRFATSDRAADRTRSEEHTSELQSPCNLVCRLLLEKKNTITE